MFAYGLAAVVFLSLATAISFHHAWPQTAHAAAETKITGFSPVHAAQEAALEDRFKSSISTEEIRKQHRYFTSMPHPAGTVHDHEVAEYIAELWKKQGLEDTVIRQYDVLGTKPISTSLEMVAPSHYQAVLREAAYEIGRAHV